MLAQNLTFFKAELGFISRVIDVNALGVIARMKELKCRDRDAL